MKALLIASLVALAMPSLAFASFDTSLKYGSSGPKVQELQEFLTDQGVYTGPITGNFYSLTLAGVKRFQIAQGVTPTSGFFGPITRGVADGILSQELAQSDAEASTTPVVIQPKYTHMTDSTTTGGSSTPAPTPAPTVTAAPAVQYSIEIISIDNSKGLGDTYRVETDPEITNWGTATDTQTFIPLGAILRNGNGDNIFSDDMTVTATDANQNAVIHGTGNVKADFHYYPFNYLFRSAGDHTITFTADGVSQSVTLKAQ